MKKRTLVPQGNLMLSVWYQYYVPVVSRVLSSSDTSFGASSLTEGTRGGRQFATASCT
jgi:hypothetical protein